MISGVEFRDGSSCGVVSVARVQKEEEKATTDFPITSGHLQRLYTLTHNPACPLLHSTCIRKTTPPPGPLFQKSQPKDRTHPYNPNFALFTLGTTPTNVTTPATTTAHKFISNTLTAKSVLVAAATVANMSTSNTYPLARCHLYVLLAFSRLPYTIGVK